MLIRCAYGRNVVQQLLRAHLEVPLRHLIDAVPAHQVRCQGPDELA
jgi:hypothetical protein